MVPRYREIVALTLLKVFTNLASLSTREGSMAAKKTVFLNRAGEKIRTVPQTEVDELKDAFRVVIKDYLRVKKAQSKFESSLEMFCLKISPWSIPHRELEPCLKQLRRR
jgi:hypothetical protein